jgi:hypothetical protein
MSLVMNLAFAVLLPSEYQAAHFGAFVIHEEKSG